MPPRPGGTLAILEANPAMDIVIVAHAGFEAAASFDTFWRGGLVGREVRFQVWRIRADEVPDEDRALWLFDQWARVDDWVAAQAASE
jgi:hypothetical protein